MEDKEILNIAKLSRLELRQDEIENLKRNFNQIKNYIDLISEVDDSQIEAETADENLVVFHEDTLDESPHISPSDFSNYSDSGYFKTPKIIE